MYLPDHFTQKGKEKNLVAVGDKIRGRVERRKVGGGGVGGGRWYES